jgi:predicted AAA+ superfamily ATPase
VAISDLCSKTLLIDNALFTEFKGALTENIVAQSLVYGGFDKLFYWTSEHTAEVDFMLPITNTIIPLEVKSGLAVKSKSLKIYADKYQPPFAIRVSPLNLSKEGGILNCPLYLVERLPMLLSALIDLTPPE